MKAFKKTIVILSYFCYVAVILYILFALPMIAGYKPMPITDNHLGEDFKVGSMFYYHKVDSADMQKGFVAVYKSGTEKKIGIIYSNSEDGISIYKTGEFVRFENVLGINKTANFPIVGYYYSYIQNHVALLVIIGVILALRIMFIYVDPEKLSGEAKDTAENKDADVKDTFEESFESTFGAKVDEKKADDFTSIFASKPVEEKAEEKEEVTENKTEAKAIENKDASEDVSLTSYINNLTFTTKDGYYNADEVDAALDKIVGSIPQNATAPVENNNKALEAEVEMLKANKAEVEKECLSLRTEIENLKDSLAEKDSIISENNKKIAEYKEMELKVAKLLAAIKAGQIK